MAAFLQTKASKKFKKIFTAGDDIQNQLAEIISPDTVTARFRIGTWQAFRALCRVRYPPLHDRVPAWGAL